MLMMLRETLTKTEDAQELVEKTQHRSLLGVHGVADGNKVSSCGVTCWLQGQVE
jgi:hypothetical protein